MSENLCFIASYDDVLQFCGIDESLGERFKTIFAEAQEREITFDPIYVAASNSNCLAKIDIWTTKNGKYTKRGFDTFDPVKFTKYFIKAQKYHLENPDKFEKLNREGFDDYAYLMAHEEEINALYGKRDLSKLQQASLHYIEMNGEAVELDYIRYIATYDDLVLGAVSSKPDDKSWEEWLPEIGKTHYENTGLYEIKKGTREIVPFFDATIYVATHSYAADLFKNNDGTINETSATIGYITFGSINGLSRDAFKPNMFLANYPELLAEDIYINNEISPLKVAKIWLEKVKEGVRFDKFDPVDFKEVMGLDEIIDPFESFVNTKLKEYRAMLQKHNGMFYRFTHICGKPNQSLKILSKPVKLSKKK